MPKRDMYNANLKEQFIQEEVQSEKMKRLFRNVFEFVSKSEEEYSADICTWNSEQLRKELEKLAGLRSYSSANRAKLLKRYVQWCCDSQVPGATDVIFSIQVDGTSKIRQQWISGPDHLQRCLNDFLSPELNYTTDNILRGYCWLAFMGMSEEQIVALEDYHVDPDAGYITYNRRVIQIPNEAFVSLRILKEERRFRYYHANYGKDFVLRDRAEGNRLLRGIRNPEPNIHNLRIMLSGKIKEANKREGNSVPQLSYSRIWLSGEFYRMYKKEQAGGSVDFSYLGERAIQAREKNETPYKLKAEKGNRTENGKMRELAREYRKDYINWKAAYYE